MFCNCNFYLYSTCCCFFLTFTDKSCSTQADKQACRWRTGKGGSITDRTRHKRTLIITTDGCLTHLVFWGDASTTEGRGSAFFLHPKQCVCALWAADTVSLLAASAWRPVLSDTDEFDEKQKRRDPQEVRVSAEQSRWMCVQKRPHAANACCSCKLTGWLMKGRVRLLT